MLDSARRVRRGFLRNLRYQTSPTLLLQNEDDDSDRVEDSLSLPLTTEAACKMVVRSGAIVAILVEGWSDQAALEARRTPATSWMHWARQG